MQGTQTLLQSLSNNIRQAYTYPDRNANRLALLTLKGSHFLTDQLLLGGTAYYRHYRNDSVASNVNGNFGQLDPDTGIVDTVQANNDRSAINQSSYGFGMQLTSLAPVAGKKSVRHWRQC